MVASLDPSTYADLLSRSPPTDPQQFTPPQYQSGVRRENVQIFNSGTGEIASFPNVLIRVPPQDQSGANQPQRAYYIYKKLKKAIYGKVTLAIVLEPYAGGNVPTPPPATTTAAQSSQGDTMIWSFTPERVAIKQISWDRVSELRGRQHAEDPIKELAAMQYIGGSSAFSHAGDDYNITRCVETLSDPRYIYCVMPYYANGELFDHVKLGKFTEERSRFWFKQVSAKKISKQGWNLKTTRWVTRKLISEQREALFINRSDHFRTPHRGHQKLIN